MPSFVYNVEIVNTASGSTINNGDSLLLAPTSAANTYVGSGSSIAGDLATVLNIRNSTNTDDVDIIDGSTIKVVNKS